MRISEVTRFYVFNPVRGNFDLATQFNLRTSNTHASLSLHLTMECVAVSHDV